MIPSTSRGIDTLTTGRMIPSTSRGIDTLTTGGMIPSTSRGIDPVIVIKTLGILYSSSLVF
jgi:hypothetical protein